MPPNTLPQPSISNFGRGGMVDAVIDFFTHFSDKVQDLTNSLWLNNLVQFLWALFVVLVLSIAYFVYLYISLQRREKKKYYENFDAGLAPVPMEGKYSRAWGEVVMHLKSDNESNWKIAILEADSILSQLLEDLGYPGYTLGERLKSADKSDMLSLDSAWEAHKMRNRIAHEGATMKLTRKELGDTLAHFEKVFREFKCI